MNNLTPVDNNTIVSLINQNLKKFDWVSKTCLDDAMPIVHEILENFQREILPDLKTANPNMGYEFNFKISRVTFMQALARFEKRTGENLIDRDRNNSENTIKHMFTFALSAVFNLDEAKLSHDLFNRMMRSADGKEYSYGVSLAIWEIPAALERLRKMYEETINALNEETNKDTLQKNVEYIKTRTGLLHDLANENQAMNRDISRAVAQTLDVVEAGFKSARKMIKRISNSVSGFASK